MGRFMLRTTRSGRGVGPGIRSGVWKVLGRAPARDCGGNMILRGGRNRPPLQLVRLRRVREQSDRPGALEGGRERPLVPSARPGDSTREDLAAVAYESPQARDLLVVDVVDLLDAEAAHLA